jgi:hypothetical protein
MKKIEWSLSIGLVGCRLTGEFEVDDDVTEFELEEWVRDEVMQRVEWNYTVDGEAA